MPGEKTRGATYVGVDGVGAVVLVSIFTGATGEAAASLRADTYDVADFDVRDVVSNAGNISDDLVADDEGKLRLAPALGESVHVGAADAAVGDGDLDVVGFERLGLEVYDLEVVPSVLVWEAVVRKAANEQVKTVWTYR